MFKTATVRKSKFGVGPKVTIERVVFGLHESAKTATVAEQLRARGQIVEFAGSVEGAYHEAAGTTGDVVVIPVHPQHSLLATAKIVTSLPYARIVLLAPQDDERVRAFAEFIDANIAFESGTDAELLAAIGSWS